MAQTSYTSPVITAGTRRVAYERLALLLTHLDALNINLVSIVRNADNTITVTVASAVPPEQLIHLGLA